MKIKQLKNGTVQITVDAYTGYFMVAAYESFVDEVHQSAIASGDGYKADLHFRKLAELRSLKKIAHGMTRTGK